MCDTFMAVNAGRLALENRCVYGPHHFLLLREHFLRELVAAATRARIVGLVFGPHLPGHAHPLLLEFLFRGDDAAHLPNNVLGARHRLVPEELGVLPRNVAVVARCAYAGAVHAMDAPPVFLRDPLHRVARPSAEFIGARGMDHYLGAEYGDGANH